jgi:hypothetical protein
LWLDVAVVDHLVLGLAVLREHTLRYVAPSHPSVA